MQANVQFSNSEGPRVQALLSNGWHKYNGAGEGRETQPRRPLMNAETPKWDRAHFNIGEEVSKLSSNPFIKYVHAKGKLKNYKIINNLSSIP